MKRKVPSRESVDSWAKVDGNHRGRRAFGCICSAIYASIAALSAKYMLFIAANIYLKLLIMPHKS